MFGKLQNPRQVMFHTFKKDISQIPLPEKFTCPFCYSPHLLSLMAANQVQEYIRSREDWTEELQNGKMFGVLVVKKENGEIGFVASFSGQIQGQNLHDYFVPPVYDLIVEDGFFKQGERQITEINRQIEDLQQNPIFAEFEAMTKSAEQQLVRQKELMKQSKIERDKKREETSNETELGNLIRESQFQKAEYKRLQRKLEEQIAETQQRRDALQERIDQLCHFRKEKSAALQTEIFEHFVFLNANGERKSALQIFGDIMPPSGTGECAAPRLLQYAYNSHLQPIAMAEFWWGKSPKDHIRRQGSFYTACKQKCEPLLNFMLQGLDVEENRFLKTYDLNGKIHVVYEDDVMVVVNKPIDVLSVPGNIPQPSVWGWAHEKYGDAYVVHRLDMATSGLLVIAKNLDACRKLQRQFENREVKKEYVAVVDGLVEQDEGTISLPLRPDFDERPIQVVDLEKGKMALTYYNVLKRENGRTRVLFRPQTGRTHQLRVHSAHPDGLGFPIVGDTLYGTMADRLYLHASKITFSHPVSGQTKVLCCEPNF